MDKHVVNAMGDVDLQHDNWPFPSCLLVELLLFNPVSSISITTHIHACSDDDDDDDDKDSYSSS